MESADSASPAKNRQLYLVTPTTVSVPLSKRTGMQVYLKLENIQPSGSFKLRGISNFCKKAVFERGCKQLYSASGGNAGLAAAYSAKQLNVPITVVLPESTPSFVADILKDLDANVIVHGKVWDHANEYAKKLTQETGGEYVHPFEHPDVWEGHSSMIVEAAEQMPERPDAVIVSVGGGGLFNGLVMGMEKVGWGDVPLIAMETDGANCFNAAIKAGDLVTLPDITSVAQCLGALTVNVQTLEFYKTRKNILSMVVDDSEAIKACLGFADDHRVLVEPACGAALAAVYGNTIQKLQEQGQLGPVKSVLVIVCGGSSVTLKYLQEMKEKFNL